MNCCNDMTGQCEQGLGCHRNTLRARVAAKGFPRPCADGKWLLSEIIEWEQRT